MKTSRFILTAMTAGAIALSAIPAAVHAGTANGSINVTANVLTNCTLNTSTDVAFTYDPSSPTAATAQGAVNLQCTRGTTATIDLGNGNNFSGTRRMVNGGATQFLNYGLYRDAPLLQPWGTGSGNNQTASFPASSAAQAITVYGEIPAGQSTVSAGAFSDSVTITVNF